MLSFETSVCSISEILNKVHTNKGQDKKNSISLPETYFIVRCFVHVYHSESHLVHIDAILK